MIATRHNKLGRGTGFGVGDDGDAAYTVTAAHGHAVCAGFKYHQGAGAGNIGYISEQSPTLTADWHNPAVCIQGTIARGAQMGQNGEGYCTDGACYTLNTIDRHAVLCMADDNAKAAIDEDLCGTLKVGGRTDHIKRSQTMTSYAIRMRSGKPGGQGSARAGRGERYVGN